MPAAVEGHCDPRFEPLRDAFTANFAERGERATTFSNAQQPVIDKYLRQTLEENAGKDNEGVRLALYFERKAPKLTSFYQVLADPALAKVVRTLLSLPDAFAKADVDKQVKLFETENSRCGSVSRYGDHSSSRTT